MINAEAEAERAAPASVFHYYRRLIALRHADPVVQLGDFTMLLPEHPHVYAFTRCLDGTRLLVLGNFSGEDQQVDLGRRLDGESEVVIGNYPGAPVFVAGDVTLRPWEGLVFRRFGPFR